MQHTVPRGDSNNLHTPTLTSLPFVRPGLDHTLEPEKLPERHAKRINTTKKHQRFQTIYFVPESLSEPAILFGSPITSPATSPDTPGIRELPVHHRRAEPKSAKNNQNLNHKSLPLPSQEEMDYVVEQLEKADYLSVDGVCQALSDSNSDYSISDRNDSPKLPPPSLSEMYSSPSDFTGSPSLTTGSSRSSIASLPGASLVNYTGTIAEIKRLSTGATTTKVRSRTTLGLQQGPKLSLPQLFKSIALTDPKVTGQPIRFTSSTFEPGSNVLKVGDCTYLNLPYGVTSECGLRVEPRPFRRLDNKHTERADYKNQQIRLQISQRIVYAGSGRHAMLLSSETDVTHGFTSNVRAELAASVQKLSQNTPAHTPEKRQAKYFNEPPSHATYDELEGDTLVIADHEIFQETLSSATYESKTRHGNACKHTSRTRKEGTPRSVPSIPQEADEDIWVNLARSLASGNASTTVLPPSSRAFARPSPAFKDLLSLLDEIKLLHRHLFIIRIKSSSSWSQNGSSDNDDSPNQHPSTDQDRFSIPWLSAHLFQLLFAIQNNKDSNDSAAAVSAVSAADTTPRLSDQRHHYTTAILRSFKDTMALQLSEKISPSLQKKTEHDSLVPRAFFKRVRLPVELAYGLRGLSSSTSTSSSSFSFPSASSTRDEAEMIQQMIGVYAVPLFDDAVGNVRTKCWACFLVDEGLDGLLG